MARVKNCVEKAEQVKIREGFDMSMLNGQEIYDAYKTDSAKMIYVAFRFGYLQGHKAAVAEGRRE